MYSLGLTAAIEPTTSAPGTTNGKGYPRARGDSGTVSAPVSPYSPPPIIETFTPTPEPTVAATDQAAVLDAEQVVEFDRPIIERAGELLRDIPGADPAPLSGYVALAALAGVAWLFLRGHGDV